VTRLVDPNNVVTPVTVPTAVGPEPTGAKATVTFAGAIVPDGKPLPVKVTTVAPGCAEAGVALALSVTATGAGPPDCAAIMPGGVINNQERRRLMAA
jgi:hypothetical protein